MPNSGDVENLKRQIGDYLSDGVIDSKEAFAILHFGMEGGFKETEVYELIAEVKRERGLGEQDSSLAYLRSLAQQFFENDGVIDEREMFVLVEAAKKRGVSEKELDAITQPLQHKDHANTRRTKVMAGLGTLMVLFAFGFLYNSGGTPRNLFHTHSVPAKIIFRSITFDKFVVAGNRYMEKGTDGVERHLSKGFVYYISGSANVNFDLGVFKYEPTPGKPDSGRLVCTIQNTENLAKGGELLPYTIDVDVSQADQTEVYTVAPQPISEQEARAAGKAVGAVLGLGGAYVGAKAGASLSPLLQVFPIGRIPVIGKLGANFLGTAAGASVGAAVSGVTGYVATSHLLSGLELTEKMSEKDKTQVMSKAKELIAAEILFDEQLGAELKTAFESYARHFYASQGKTVDGFSYQVT